MKVYTVSELTREIRAHLESGWSDVWVEGELSNFRPSQMGHFYFTLKDAEAQLKVVMFRHANRSLRFKLEEGLQLLAAGHLSVYEARGEYQLIAEHLEPKGLGALQLAFEQLRKKLELEGLFREERKRPLPFFPQRIGVVTSPAAAALRDILQILGRRQPNLEVLIAPVAVQGEGAPTEIAGALEALGHEPLDLVVVARGGGSIEDLWAFNEEIVARAIAASPWPVISAVGHETDFTIADFVADLRAPTPSAAAELAVPVKEELHQKLEGLKGRLVQAMRFEGATVRLDGLRERLLLAHQGGLVRWKDRLGSLRTHLGILNPLAVLDRGFALATTSTGKPLRDAEQVDIGETVHLRLARGGLVTKVSRID